MAHFYGEIKGQAKTTAGKIGSIKSGLNAHIRGWDIGCRIECKCEDGQDIIKIYKTGGSNNSHEQLIATLQ